MINEHTPSRDSLDLINAAIIRETFIGYKEEEEEAKAKSTTQINKKENKTEKGKEEKEDDSYDPCCSDECFKWWFFHSSFQVPKESIIEEELLNKPNKHACCNLCSDCIELKLKNCCATNEYIKEYCSNCFYNGCQLNCCCFTIVLTSK